MVSVVPPEPVRRPIIYQDWTTFSALHWSYAPETIETRLPEGLSVDTFEERAWVSITPFLMERVRLPGLPPVPGVSTFPETNVRTYVRDREGRDGLWFFALEAGLLPFVVSARVGYRLPYNWAAMSVDDDGAVVRYRSRRRWPDSDEATHDIAVVPGRAMDPDEAGARDIFLMHRWRGYAPLPIGLGYTPVEHEPWPLWHATVDRLEETLLAACGLPAPSGDPIVHHSPGVHARLGPPRRV